MGHCQGPRDCLGASRQHFILPPKTGHLRRKVPHPRKRAAKTGAPEWTHPRNLIPEDFRDPHIEQMSLRELYGGDGSFKAPPFQEDRRAFEPMLCFGFSFPFSRPPMAVSMESTSKWQYLNAISMSTYMYMVPPPPINLPSFRFHWYVQCFLLLFWALGKAAKRGACPKTI